MHTLHVHAVRFKDEAEYLNLVRAIRAARVVAGTPGTMYEAADILDTAREKGYALVCSHESYETIKRAAETATNEANRAALFALDRSPEWFAARQRAADGLTPEESIAAHAANEAAGVNEAAIRSHTDTALVLMQVCNGNPGAALLLANRLRATTEDDIYGDVAAALIRAFRAVNPDEGEAEEATPDA